MQYIKLSIFCSMPDFMLKMLLPYVLTGILILRANCDAIREAELRQNLQISKVFVCI
jgi:hypothetical protein